MRKRKIHHGSPKELPDDEVWLDLGHLAQVELTSEDAAHPVESALIPGIAGGWLASDPGEQIVRLLFDEPLGLRRIHLLFSETMRERTQEFVLSWSRDGGRSYREIVRQQFTFSPPDTIREIEDYRVVLDGVNALELRIIPDISKGPACASLEQLRLA